MRQKMAAQYEKSTEPPTEPALLAAGLIAKWRRRAARRKLVPFRLRWAAGEARAHWRRARHSKPEVRA
jgi:hypothetical protein